jgi:hypothetical protein
LIISGGDDNTLGCTILSFDDETVEYISSSLIVRSAHAAAVTAIGTLNIDMGIGHSKDMSLDVVTASNDQMIKIWNVKVDSRKPSVKGINIIKVGKYASPVADISSLAVFEGAKNGSYAKDAKVLICGVGAEVWSYRRD